MSRLASLLLVALLAVSASGLPDLISLEPCAPGVESELDAGGCAATCVRCSCCAQPTDLFVAIPRLAGAATVSYPQASLPVLPLSESREILHVPKSHLLDVTFEV